MKKIILGSLIASSMLMAEVTTVVPYIGMLEYDSNQNKSIKDKSQLAGVYASVGDLSYLLEVAYGYLNTSYKDSTLDDLYQHDLSLMYSKYKKNYMLKGGLHHVSTTDSDLGDGNILALEFGGYKPKGNDKYRYGLEGYISNYKDGHNENYDAKNISIIQLTPYFSFFKTINADIKNYIELKLNSIIALDYVNQTYLSCDISDTLYYKDYFATAKAYFGEMRTGVKDGGFSVYNTLDLMKSGYSLKLGYYFSKDFALSASYGVNTYEEYGQTTDGTSSIALVNFSYSF